MLSWAVEKPSRNLPSPVTEVGKNWVSSIGVLRWTVFAGTRICWNGTLKIVRPVVHSVALSGAQRNTSAKLPTVIAVPQSEVRSTRTPLLPGQSWTAAYCPFGEKRTRVVELLV